MAREEVLVAIGAGSSANDVLNYLEALVRRHLVTGSEVGRYTVRHRVIAERVWELTRTEGDPGEAVEGLLYAIAAKRSPTDPRHSRENRIIIRLLNHSFMIEDVRDIDRIRAIYDNLEPLLEGDYHYWLQRGSLEVEIGDLRRAENFLGQALGLAPTDSYVLTEWNYMRLKRAAADAASGTPGSTDLAESAMEDLRGVIDAVGQQDSYPYHVLGSQGLSWVRRAVLSQEERGRILGQLLSVVREGRRLHPSRRELEQLEFDVQKEYLMTATEGVDPGIEE